VAVIAGPGTGKTNTLVCRLAHLVAQGAAPEAIGAVTFTKKAAAELSQRLAKALGPKQARRVTVGTFHGICLELARRAGAEPTVVDEAGALALMGDAAAALGLEVPVKTAKAAVSLVKNGAARPGEGVPQALYDAYCASLARYGVLDYDDVLLRGLETAGAGFAHLLVDEFQDVSPVQYALARAWAKETLFVIGDPDQAIYGFRGADAGCFDRLLAAEPQGELIRLTENYRSTPEILLCAARIKGAALAPTRPAGAQPLLVEVEGPAAEARYVAREINRRMGGVDMLAARQETGLGFSDFAVLCRTHRQTEALEEAFSKEGIPFAALGKGEFLSDPSVEQATAFFRFLQNPRDAVALRAWLPGLGLGRADALAGRYGDGEKTLAALGTLLAEAGAEGRQALALLEAFQPPSVLPEKAVALWARLVGQTPALAYLQEAAKGEGTLAGFLNTLLFGREGDLGRRGGKGRGPEAVTLTTLHGAKGLEFPVVFLCGVNTGLLPYDRAGLEEELRLFYVGVTRAREALVLSTYGAPSEFLAPLEGTLLRQRPGPAFEQIRLF
jgi:superfamily I DNA/RNA helicase